MIVSTLQTNASQTLDTMGIPYAYYNWFLWYCQQLFIRLSRVLGTLTIHANRPFIDLVC